MRVIAALLIFSAAPAAAGTITAMSFGGSAPTHTLVADGVEATREAGFTLYRHGVWPAAPLSAADAGREAANLSSVPSDAIVSPAAVATPSRFADACAAGTVSPRAGLAERTNVARRVYWPLVRDAECRHGIPGGLLDALVLRESRYDPSIVSRAGAGGLAQLMPRTAADLGVHDRFDPLASLDGGARYLRSMLDRYRSVPIALAAYNAGMGSVDRAGGIPANRETPGYVRAVLGYFNDGAGRLTPAPVTAHAVSLSFMSPNPE